jgi:hypothetical protein
MLPKHIRKTSQDQEQRVARDIGGRTMAASGACHTGGGGDARASGKTRVECKFTQQHHYVLKQDTLNKIELQAIRGGLETPVLQLEFRCGHIAPSTFAILRWGDYNLLNPIRATTPLLVLNVTKGSCRLERDDLDVLYMKSPPILKVWFTDEKTGAVKVYAIVPWNHYLMLENARTNADSTSHQ